MLADRYVFRQVVLSPKERKAVLISNGPALDRQTTKFFYGAGLKRIGSNGLLTVVVEGSEIRSVNLKVILYSNIVDSPAFSQVYLSPEETQWGDQKEIYNFKFPIAQ